MNSKNQLIIRKAIKDDIREVAKIYEKIIALEEKGLTTTGWQRNVYPTEKTAAEALENDELFVMEDRGEVVASAKINRDQVPVYAECKWEYDAPENEVMVIHTLVVDPDRSGNGYGSEFVAYYENFALENGCRFLRMDTNEKNAAARKLYNSLGYSEPGIVSCEFNGINGVNLVCLEKLLNIKTR